MIAEKVFCESSPTMSVSVRNNYVEYGCLIGLNFFFNWAVAESSDCSAPGLEYVPPHPDYLLRMEAIDMAMMEEVDWCVNRKNNFRVSFGHSIIFKVGSNTKNVFISALCFFLQ